MISPALPPPPPPSQDSTDCHPRLHSIWPLLLDLLLASERSHGSGEGQQGAKEQQQEGFSTAPSPSLVALWRQVVEGCLIPSSHERR